MFVKYGEEYAELCELMGDEKEAAYAREEVKKMFRLIMIGTRPLLYSTI